LIVHESEGARKRRLQQPGRGVARRLEKGSAKRSPRR